jgi:hypothetical protein
VKASDIPDQHVLDLAQHWLDSRCNELGVVDALVAEGAPEKLAFAKVERLCRRGLMEYGTTPRFAWPK